MKKYFSSVLVLFSLLVVSPQVFASKMECLGFYSKVVLDVRHFEGRPYFETMKAVREQMDTAAVTPFRILSAAEVLKKAQEFHTESYFKVLKLFVSREEARQLKRDVRIKEKAEAKLVELIEELQGKEVTGIPMKELDRSVRTPHIVVAIKRAMDKLEIKGNILNAMNLATFLSIASGGGSRVVLNEGNFFVNVGYEKDGMDRAEKSGRSSSTSPHGGFNDATDTFLLTSLHKQINNKRRNPTQFYRSMLELLIKSRTDNYQKLTNEEQGNLTDFLAVYSAEFRRSMMSDLKMHRWMDDLAEVYFISGYGSRAGKVVNQEGFSDGQATTYFAVGANGSGIGVMRGYRRYLQKHVTMAVRKFKPELIENIEALIGKRISSRTDVFHEFMIFINDPRNQQRVQRNGDQIIEAMTDLMSYVSANHEDITAYIAPRITADDPVIVRQNEILESKRRAREAKKQSQ